MLAPFAFASDPSSDDFMNAKTWEIIKISLT